MPAGRDFPLLPGTLVPSWSWPKDLISFYPSYLLFYPHVEPQVEHQVGEIFQIID